MSNYKIHPHNECAICSKPKHYKRKVLDKETLKELMQDEGGSEARSVALAERSESEPEQEYEL